MGRYEADHILFGAAYYDEYLMMKGIYRIDEDMAMMKAAGLNVIRIAESTWSTCEPQPGVFDFTYGRVDIKKLQMSISQLEKGGYPHFMLKEIYLAERARKTALFARPFRALGAAAALYPLQTKCGKSCCPEFSLCGKKQRNTITKIPT